MVTFRIVNSDKDVDMGYGCFFLLRCTIARQIDPDFGDIYADTYLSLHAPYEWEDRLRNKFESLPNRDEDIYGFLILSDCDGYCDAKMYSKLIPYIPDGQEKHWDKFKQLLIEAKKDNSPSSGFDMMEYKIGITENGDASRNYAWMGKADDMDIMILITKNITDEFINKVLPYSKKTVVHATCTGYGGTVLEPNVPVYTTQLEQIRKLIAFGFPADHIVVRIDPIIPTPKGIAKFEKIVEEIHRDVKRFRISVPDNYEHVRDRFAQAGIPVLYDGNYKASDEEFANVDKAISRLKYQYPEISIEACAEKSLHKAECIGCVSDKDIELCGLSAVHKKIAPNKRGCMCLPKIEMLPFNHPCYCTTQGKFIYACCNKADMCKDCTSAQYYGCENMCLYCYWRT